VEKFFSKMPGCVISPFSHNHIGVLLPKNCADIPSKLRPAQVMESARRTPVNRPSTNLAMKLWTHVVRNFNVQSVGHGYLSKAA
jgi:hypothetical protein